MITENNIKTLEYLVAKYALEDYRVTNPDTPSERKRRMRKIQKGLSSHNPYSLSDKTNEAREMLHLAYEENVTKEEIETVKAYLLRHKLLESSLDK